MATTLYYRIRLSGGTLLICKEDRDRDFLNIIRPCQWTALIRKDNQVSLNALSGIVNIIDIQ